MEVVGVLDSVARSSQTPTLPAGARREAHMAAKRGSGQLGLICMENKVWRGKSQGVALVGEAARGPGAG